MDYDQVDAAIGAARDEMSRPSIVIAKTHIGYGSEKQDTAKAHSDPLGEEDVRHTKRNYGWPEDKTFYVPDEALAHFREALERGGARQREWQQKLDAYASAYPAEAALFRQVLSG